MNDLLLPYKTPRSLPSLVPSRLPTFNRVLRALQSDNQHHILIEAPEGSGRRTLAAHIMALAPRLGRKHRFVVSAGSLTGTLYEAPDPTAWFQNLHSLARRYPRALLLIEQPELLIESIERHELRRLVRFFHETIKNFDLRCLVIATPTSQSELLGRSKTLETLIQTVELPPMTSGEVESIVSARSDKAWADEVIELASRFFPASALPGSGTQLLRLAAAIATQSQEPLALAHIHEAVAEQKGIPVEVVSSASHVQVQTLEENLGKRIIGQDHAVTTVTSVLRRAFAGLRSPSRPIASFLFLGPSGVGKTELAKVLAESLYQTPRSFARLDMSEFSEAHTVQRLIGAPPGYVGYEEGGQLTGPVADEPYSLVLLDEIEKAHTKVYDIFLQLLDDGRLTDGRGTTVDFRHTVVIATSNIGLRQIVAATESGSIHDRETFLRDTLLPLLVEYFRPEFLNRFDAIVVFQPLAPEALRIIAIQEVERLRQQLGKRGTNLSVTDPFLDRLSRDAYQPAFGARPLKRLIQERIEAPLATRLIDGTLKQGEIVEF